MKLLIVGSGGREHALAWKLAQSPNVERVFVAPGNAGTAEDAENVPLAIDDFPGLIKFARQNQVDLTVVGPEGPLCGGIVDAFQAQGLKVLGPTRNAAQLECSKAFCKHVLRAADVPTADFQVFRSADDARRYIEDRFPDDQPESVPLVVKADGLAAGKGVFVCSTRQEVLQAIELIAEHRVFGSAGDRLLVEQRLIGQEASVMALTDGRTLLTLPPAQDHKAAYDGDQGPNTGGMGAFTPTPLVTDETLHWIEEHVLVPTVHAMKRSRRPFRGFLYAGLMITPQGPRVLEYNVRLGDPECQPILMRCRSDLAQLLMATVEGRLSEFDATEWDPRAAVCVVMANEGYPGPPIGGHEIRGLDEAAKLPDVKVFHAGTKREEDRVVAAGGRVLGVTALGDSVAAAKLQAYRAVKLIRWRGAWCRKDIGDKAMMVTHQI